ncbi:ABC transporter ATP-binding protein [Puia dinghuensis]|uniref:ABC transporter ATP-binding protein n=2 Tax=Puia dinghuensis TaxID=1792502 RepID=A0A8J2U6D4_9BACT|nr:ABC transporter ATP-binding protein [Puia dinghuensis]
MGMALAWAASPSLLIRYTLLGMFNAVMPPISVYLSAQLVNKIANARIHATHFQDILPLILGLWATIIIQRSVGAYIGYGRNLYIRRVELEAERRLLAKAAKIDMGHFDNSDWYDRLSRARRDVSWRPGDLTWSVLGLSGNIVTIVLMAGLLASLHWLLVVLALAASFISLAIESRITSRLYKYFYKETPEERERQYIGDMFVQSRSIKEIRAFVLGDYLLGRHHNISEGLFKQRETIYRSGARISMLSGIVSGTILGLAYVFVAIRGIAGTIDPGGVVLVIGAFTAVSGTLGQITSTFVAVDQHTTFLDDYFSFLAIDPLLPVPADPRPIPSGTISDIVFDNVSFSYPGGNGPAVENLDLHIRSGELIALVGENGAGKSTLVKLLLRFYDVEKGTIRIGGVDIKDMDPEILRSRIGVLFQDYATYELSVKENIVMGWPYRDIEEERIAKALKDSRSEWLVKKLPNGLESKVGRLFEGGHDLSGGEWQRLALARIMYRDADIWILDEPTSSLDPEAESAIFAELKENLKGRIGIVISHRFSTVRIADRIAVISDGRVTELGNHEELLKAGNRYAELFELQAAGYR